MKNFLLLLFVLAGMAMAQAASDKKFHNKASKEVWSTDIDIMNPSAEIPSELSDGQSAVIIGAYYGVKAEANDQQSVSRSLSTKTTCTSVNRIMVKLLDQAAVDYYSDFSYGGQTRMKRANGYVSRKIDNAFGARIFKPDGSMQEVDLSEALVETSGKKGKDVESYKIVIPGLEVGDVLEYFYYTKEVAESTSPQRMLFPFCKRYPVMNMKISGEFDPDLTVECRSVNGAHDLAKGFDEKSKKNTVTLHASGISAMPDEEWTLPLRQIPYIEMQVLNNTSPLGISSIKRREGVHFLPAGVYYNDIRTVTRLIDTKDSKAMRKAQGTIKAFRKQHPQASRKEIADATWLALMHSMICEKESLNDMELAICMHDILSDQGFEPDSLGIGFTCSRESFSINDILSWGEPDYVAVVGDDIYYMGISGDYMPGEFPASYHGEQVGAFMGKRENLSKGTMLREMRVPQTRATQNALKQEMTLKVGVDGEPSRLVRQAAAIGGAKGSISLPQDINAYLTSIEDFLEIPEKNRHKRINQDDVEFAKRTTEFMREEAETQIGSAPSEITTAEVKSWGNLPSGNTASWEMECEFNDLTEDLGDDIELKVGKLLGNTEKLTNEQKTRSLDVMIPSPRQTMTSVIIEIPQGYKVDEASLEALKVNTSTTAGQVMMQPQILDNGNLKVQYMLRFNKSHIPVEQWPNFAVLIDAAADVSASSVILTKQ